MKTMMKIVAAMLIAVMLLTSAALAAGKIQTTGNVNIRKGAGLNYGKASVVKSGKVLSYDKTSKDERGVIWYHVKGGWVSSKYATQIDSDSKNASKSEKVSNKSEKVSTKSETTSAKTVKATGNVNLRKGPGLDYTDIGTVKKGKTASFLGTTKNDSRGVTWYKVSFNGKTGWVSSRYAKLGK